MGAAGWRQEAQVTAAQAELTVGSRSGRVLSWQPDPSIQAHCPLTGTLGRCGLVARLPPYLFGSSFVILGQ